MTNQEIPSHIAEYANNMLSLGTKMTFEQICDMKMKSEAKQNKKFGSKKESDKAQSRKNVSEMKIDHNSSDWLAAKNRENALKNLPSSLR